MAPLLVTLNDLDGHFPVAGLFTCNPSNILQYFTRFQPTARSHGPSATAGLFVPFGRTPTCYTHRHTPTQTQGHSIYRAKHTALSIARGINCSVKRTERIKITCWLCLLAMTIIIGTVRSMCIWF